MCQGNLANSPASCCGPTAGAGLGPSVLWVSTSSIPLLQLSKVTSSVPRAAPPPLDQEMREGSAAALRPRGVRACFGQRKGEFVPLAHIKAGREGTSPTGPGITKEKKKKKKEKRVWVGGEMAARGPQSQAAARAASSAAVRSSGSPPRQQPGIAEEGPTSCRRRPCSGIAGWAAGSSYLVLCSSSRSQVGSVCPILYRSLESSMLWSL